MEICFGFCSRRVFEERDNVAKKLVKLRSWRKIGWFCLNKWEWVKWKMIIKWFDRGNWKWGNKFREDKVNSFEILRGKENNINLI